MGKTVVVFRIKCADMEKLDETAALLRTLRHGEVRDVQRIPIGFGIEVLKIAVLIPEKQDEVLDMVQQEINTLPNVEESEIEGMTLL